MGAITPQLTHQMTLTCSLNSTHGHPRPTGLVGRDIPEVTSTPEDISVLTSIVILMDSGLQLARITEHTAAVLLMNDAKNAHVSGNVTKTGSLHGYLSVTWTYPTEAQAGMFICEVNGLTKEGRGVLYKTSVDVEITEATVSDLLKELHDLNVYVQDMQKKQQSFISDQQTQISAHQAELSTHKTQISSLQTQLAESRHLETGTLDCQNPKTWTDGRYDRPTADRSGDLYRYAETKAMSHTFSTPYTRPPIVFLSINHKQTQNSNEYYGAILEKVDKTGFTMRCGSWTSPGYQLIDLEVGWISFPA